MSSLKVKKQSLIKKLMKHDYNTFEHSERVADLSYRFGFFLGYEEKDLKVLHEAARFHDIGKLRVDSNILTKDGKLDDTEFSQILKHPLYSEEVLKEAGFSKEILQAVRSHHENYNGTGYPDKISYDEINSHAAIIRIVDSYDSMISSRPYSEPKAKEKAIEEILSLKGTWYNPDLAEKFSEYIINNEPDLGLR